MDEDDSCVLGKRSKMAKKEQQENTTSEKTDKSNEKEPKDYNLKEFSEAIEFIKKFKAEEQPLKEAMSNTIALLQAEYEVDPYFWLFLYDEKGSINSLHSDRIYQGLNGVNNKDIALFLTTPGGSIEPAYLISKTCKKRASSKFIVAIPRKAKSAGTLISLGATEIHMGQMSELGPIDPQIGNFPALAVSNALEKIAEMASSYPLAADMFSKYLNNQLDLRVLGYFERINESAMQYAERLLKQANLPDNTSVGKVADHLVNHYKDHSFVIDIEEAKEILGENIVKEDTKEYNFTNRLYGLFDMTKFMYGYFHDREFTFVGNKDSGALLTEKQKDE